FSGREAGILIKCRRLKPPFGGFVAGCNRTKSPPRHQQRRSRHERLGTNAMTSASPITLSIATAPQITTEASMGRVRSHRLVRLVSRIAAYSTATLGSRNIVESKQDVLLGHRWCDSTERALNDLILDGHSGFGSRRER